MAYIGKQPLIGNFQVCDAISTVNGQAAYTLQVGGANVSPETVNNMIVSVNGVIQKPTASYTVSGSTITFTSALVTGDVIDFIQILGNVLDLGVPSDNTVTTAKLADSSVSLAKLTATGTKDATTFLRGDNTFAVAGGTNTPAFHVSLGSTQTPSNNVATKVALDTELVDTDNAFASNKFTVPVGKAGTYFIRGQIGFVQGDGNASTVYYGFTTIYKNGSQIDGEARVDFRNSAGFGVNIDTSVVITLAEGDYIELYGRLNANLPRFIGGVQGTFLQGYKLLT